jgi:transposase
MTPEEIEAMQEENRTLKALVAELLPLREHVRQQDLLIAQLQQQGQALQERVDKDSHNSHLPPSSDRFVRQPRSLCKKRGKKAGGQPGHEGTTLRWQVCPDEGGCMRSPTVPPVSRICRPCLPPLQIERRQVVEVPTPRLWVQEHQAQQKQCPACQQMSAASFPPEVAAPLQYGPRPGAIAVSLVQQQLLPWGWGRACELLGDLLGAPLSEGTLASLLERCAATLQPVEEQIKQALTGAEVVHQDETGLDVSGQRHWLHGTCTDQLTHYAVHPKRGQQALEAIGILPRFDGTSGHDGWRAYFHYACHHALWVVHLLRELTDLAEDQGLAWAAELIALVLAMKAATDQARAQGLASLHPLEGADWQAQFVAIVTQADATTPDAQTPPRHKGRVKQSAARTLLDGPLAH